MKPHAVGPAQVNLILRCTCQYHVACMRFRPALREASSYTATVSPSPYARREGKTKGLFLRITAVTLTGVALGWFVRFRQEEPRKSTLNPITFVSYQLVSKEPASSTSSIFTFRPTLPDGNRGVYESAWRVGIWSATFKQPQLQIGRDYTPLPPPILTRDPSRGAAAEESSAREDDGSIRFLIRREPHGEVSRYLHGLDIGAKIEIRGPNLEYQISPEVKDILFIAGGTGIAPALQAAYTLLSRTSDGNKPRMHILWASRQREDCLGGLNHYHQAQSIRSRWWWRPFKQERSASLPPQSSSSISPQTHIVRELEALSTQYPDQLTVHYFVDEENTFISKDSILAFTGSDLGITATMRTPAPPQPDIYPGDGGKKVILISGPEGFISYLAGPKVWAQGLQQQGPLRGMMKELDLRGWSVWKL